MAWADVKAAPEKPFEKRLSSSKPNACLWQDAQEMLALTLYWRS